MNPNDFPVLNQTINGHPLVYFDNAATSQKPQCVVDALQNYYQEYNSNIHRGAHFLADKATNAYEQGRQVVAEFINARQAQEIVFTKNTTESINLVAQSYVAHNLKPGDEILISRLEHHSNFVPWLVLSQKYGFKLKFIELKADYHLDLSSLDQLITKQTKFIAISQASNVLGVENPVKEIIRRAKDVGAKTLIDASQSAPHGILNVREIDCDFAVCTGHKMCGPTGIGVLYGKMELLEKTEPFLTGGGMIREVFEDQYTPAEVPEKFEAGTPNIAGVIGLKAGLEYLQKVGVENIRQQEKELTEYLLQKLAELPFVKLIGPIESNARLPVFSFLVEGVHAHDVSDILSHEGICVRAGHHCCQPLMKKLQIQATTRASLYFYNTLPEIDIFIKGLKKVNQIFS